MNIYSEPKHCVYLLIYKGNKLPPFYIGSGILSKIEKGYKGSVKSKLYKETFKNELYHNPHLFEIKIIKKYYSRKMAYYKEKILQTRLNVVKSSLYMNMSIAKDFGWFGMNTSGKNSPVYGKRWKNSQKYSEKISSIQKRLWRNPEYRNKMSKLRKNKLPLSKTGIEKRKKLYKDVLSLYNSKPELPIEYNYIARNGKYFAYDNAFANVYYKEFGLKSARGLLNIIRDDNLSKKLLCKT